ncbi:hypothetical protein EV356DRAFT_529077 [Viridothelium virens]|uniref:Uncharacterized protein n=1 Tax=Viridothelium virens TaxID=1048519 RepID=A0A6A6HM53_VIRVR|nr:hypothetical protein EV356DRAFT_529077 [Viridothelium virens]
MADVRTVRRLLASKPAFSGGRLPNELVLSILDCAEYHPILTSERTEWMQVTAEHPPYCQNVLYLVGNPLPVPGNGHTLKILDVRFTIQSRDQGWTTEDDQSIRNSSSWFEVSIVRPDDLAEDDAVQISYRGDFPAEYRDSSPTGLHFDSHSGAKLVERTTMTERVRDADREPQWEGSHTWFLHANRVAYKNDVTTEVVWHRGGNWEGAEDAGNGQGFIETLKPRDRIVVWVRATRRGWANKVANVKVDVKYKIL